MKTNKILVALVLLLALALGVSLYYCSQKKQTGVVGEVQPDAENITWSYEDLGTDKDTWTPSTKVTVTIWGKSYNAGTYAGSCSPRSHDGFGKNEASGITCWWAGGGDDIGVFKTDSKITLQHRILDEGTAETGGVTGEFQILTSIE